MVQQKSDSAFASHKRSDKTNENERHRRRKEGRATSVNECKKKNESQTFRKCAFKGNPSYCIDLNAFSMFVVFVAFEIAHTVRARI